MILADTSVWVDHLRRDDAQMRQLLDEDDIGMHPFVLGELSLGHLHPREDVLEYLRTIPDMQVAFDEEVVSFIGSHRLFGTGIGYVDAHLLASVWLTGGARVWTRDRRMRRIAEALGIAAAGFN